MDTLHKTNAAGLRLIKSQEGLRLRAYQCPAKVWTIGYGNTYFEDGTRVKQGDVITQARADSLFLRVLAGFEAHVNDYVVSGINDNQFAALVSFTYNCGIGALIKSSLLRMVNTNPGDVNITYAFGVWNKAGGVVNQTLKKRRAIEAKLYFTPCA